MACVDKKPKKGILKNSSSFDKTEHPQHMPKEMKWDEMNIIATHHPPDKDYGHMKIDEPPTPYSKYSMSEEEDEDKSRRSSVGMLCEDEHSGGVDPMSIASRLSGDEGPKVLKQSFDEQDGDSSDEEDRQETEEERAERKEFEKKRKLHYNEFQAVKLAKQLLEQEDDDDDDDGTILDPVAAKNAQLNARVSSQALADGEQSMDGVMSSGTPFIPQDGTPVDRIILPHSSHQ